MKSVYNFMRLLRVMFILARSDALYVLESLGIFKISRLMFIVARKSNEPKGRRLAAALIKLGPTYIKLGQALSTRADLVGEEVAAELAMLRDKLPPFSFAEAQQAIEAEFGKKLEEIYTNFVEQPVAAASIAQVHKAQTIDGRVVAVKILRPGIKQRFADDMELFYWIAGIINRNVPALRRLKPLEVVEIVQEWIRQETDLRFEAAAASELRDNMKHDSDFIVPDIDWQRTGCNVLTMEWVSGIPITDCAALKAAGLDLKEVANRAAVNFYRQVFRDGFFHGDMHPGNLFVDEQGRIIAVDFGIMGRLDVRNRAFLARIFDCFLREDYLTAAKIHFEEGIISDKYSVESFALACRSIAKPIVGRPLKEISLSKLLAQLFKVSRDFEMVLQPQLLLLQKNMMMAEGIGQTLNPDVNMWEVVKPLVKEWAATNLSRRAIIRRVLKDAFETARKIPRIIDESEKLLHELQGIKADLLKRKSSR